MRCHPVPDKPWPLSVSERNRCCLSGEMGSGKSSLVLRYVKGQFFDYQVRCTMQRHSGSKGGRCSGRGQLDLDSAGPCHAVKATIWQAAVRCERAPCHTRKPRLSVCVLPGVHGRCRVSYKDSARLERQV